MAIEDSRNWEWFWPSVVGMAKSVNPSILPYIDVTDKVNIKIPPQMPTFPKAAPLPLLPEVTMDLDANIIAQLRFDNEMKLYPAQAQEYRYAYTVIKSQQDQAKAIMEWINAHLHISHKPLLQQEGSGTLFGLLMQIKKRVAPTDAATEIIVQEQLYKARRYDSTQAILPWLEEYEAVWVKVIQLEMPDCFGTRGQNLFLGAVAQFNKTFAESYMSIMDERLYEDKQPKTVLELIETLRNHQRRWNLLATIGDSSTATTDKAVGVASFKENGKKCLCGEGHRFEACCYLNPSIRTKWWKGKNDIFEKINKDLENPKLTVARSWGYDGEETVTPKSNTDVPQIPQNGSVGKAVAMLRNTRKSVLSARREPFHLTSKWILDQGADVHVANSLNYFEPGSLRKSGDMGFVGAGKDEYPIEGYGTVRLPIQTNEEGEFLVLINVAYIPGFMTNCVALDFLNKVDIHWSSRNPTMLERTGDIDPFCYLEQSGRHWAFVQPAHAQQHYAVMTSSHVQNDTEMTPEEAHFTLGHAGTNAIEHLEGNTTGLRITDGPKCPTTKECSSCACAKAKQLISRRTDSEYPTPDDSKFYRMNMDILPFTPSYNGHDNATHSQCDRTRYMFLNTHQGKREAADYSIAHIKLAETQFDGKVVRYRTDGETVLNSRRWIEFAQGKGIVREASAPDTSEQNGKAEASGKSVVIIARSAIIASNIPESLFSEALLWACYVYNRTPKRLLNWKTPFESVTGRKPNLGHMHPFGCKSYSLQHNLPRLQKMQSRALIGYLVGYDSRNIYRIWIPSRSKVIRTRDVVFDDKAFYDPSELDIGIIEEEGVTNFMDGLELSKAIQDDEEEEIYDSITVEMPAERGLVQRLVQNRLPQRLPQNDLNDSDDSAPNIAPGKANDQLRTPSPTPSYDSHALAPENTEALLGSVTPANKPLFGSRAGSSTQVDPSNIIEGKRTRKPKSVFITTNNPELAFHSAFATAQKAIDPVGIPLSELPPAPKHYKEMLKHPYSSSFKVAMDKEINKLTLMKAIEFTTYSEAQSLPATTQLSEPIPLMWVFTYKSDSNGFVTSFKARIVARGDLQQTEEDTYAATAAAYSTRALAAIIGAHGLRAYQYDAINAYGNSRKEIPLCAKNPPGYEDQGELLLVHFGMYGLKPSALDWYNTFKAAALSIGLTIVPGSPCIFQNLWLIMLVYVDDILIAFHPQYDEEFKLFELQFLQLFEFRQMGEVDHFLGIRFVRDLDAKKIWLVQDAYISKLESRFEINTARRPRTPLPSAPMVTYEGTASASQIHQYQQKCGSINWPAVLTRPDIAWSISELSKFLQNPGPLHIAAVDHLLEYLSCTKYLALCYNGDTTSNLFMGYTDASFADDVETRRSSHGYAFSFYGALVTWKAQKQRTVTTSSTESEILALSQAGREMVWWQRFFSAIDFISTEEMILYCDNRQALRAVTEGEAKLATKMRHVDIHQMWIRQEVQKGHITVRWCGTDDMVADGFTKHLTHSKHARFVEMVGLVDITDMLAPKWE
jgi:hypothetical protein